MSVKEQKKKKKKYGKKDDYYFILSASALLKGTFIASAKDENSPRNLEESLYGIIKSLHTYYTKGTCT